MVRPSNRPSVRRTRVTSPPAVSRFGRFRQLVRHLVRRSGPTRHASSPAGPMTIASDPPVLDGIALKVNAKFTPYACLATTLAKGFYLKRKLKNEFKVFEEKKGIPNRFVIHGLRPQPEYPRREFLRVNLPNSIDEAMKNEIGQKWFDLNGENFDSTEAVAFVNYQISSHAIKFFQFKTPVEYVKFAINMFDQSDLSRQISVIREGLKSITVDGFGEWYPIKVKKLKARLMAVFGYIPVLDLFQCDSRVFLLGVNLFAELKTGSLVDPSAIDSKDRKLNWDRGVAFGNNDKRLKGNNTIYI